MPRFLVGQRHSEFATLARVEGMHMARHIVRRKPRSYSVRVKKSLVDGLAPALIILDTRVLALLAQGSVMLARILYGLSAAGTCSSG